LDIATANDPKLVKCQCGNVLEIVPGRPDYNQKDEKGIKFKKEAAEHMALYRLRCNECAQNYCVLCAKNPYHAGYTCESAAAHQEARKCRFCQEEIKGASISMIPAFKDVCRQPDCIELMNKSCQKMHPCGHPCRGFKDESKCLACLEEGCIEIYN